MTRVRNFCFTINNPIENELEMFLLWDALKYCIIGQEQGESGTPHLQCYAELANSKSLSSLKKQLPRAHIEARKGTSQQAADYCKKEGDFKELGTLSKQGQRTDLETAAKMTRISISTHEYRLRFSISKTASTQTMQSWMELKTLCESGRNKEIVLQIKEMCQLEQNQNLPYLNRVEGGLGWDNNRENKEIRFVHGFFAKFSDWFDNDIIMDNIFDTEIDTWSYEELDDLTNAFVETAESYCPNAKIRGCIEMTSHADDF